MSQSAIILFAHGSRDPLWRQPMDAVARRIGELDPTQAVRCAFLELCAPELGPCVNELVQAGATRITVVPMFLGVGKHAREDLPVLLEHIRSQHPHIDFRLQLAIGEQARLVDLLAEIALEP